MGWGRNKERYQNKAPENILSMEISDGTLKELKECNERLCVMKKTDYKNSTFMGK